MVRNFNVIMVCLLLLAGIGCSKSPYQFALDAVAAKPEFDKDRRHWAMQYTNSSDTTRISPEDANRLMFLFGALQGHPQNINLLKEGEIVVCWQDKGKGVHLSIFNSTAQTEQASLSLFEKECASGLLGQ